VWLSETLAGLMVASGVGYLAAAYTVSRWLTRPAPGRIRATPADYGLPWERLECRTTDGLHLAGWVVTPPRPRATVVLCHGVRGNREKTLSRTAFLAAAGYRCVAFDHRAHGESTGRRTSFGYHESRDVRAILDLARRQWPGQRLAVLGISMGAAALCYAAEQTRSCDAVILESLYRDIGSAFVSRIGTSYPPWFRRLSRGVVWLTERRLGLRLAQLAPVAHVGDLAPAPVLLLTGSADPHATPADTQELFERCRGPRELWLVPRAGHLDVCETGGAAYRERILGFLNRYC
jgi:alpha-beta hydrolase superfamily lysophospholipase